MKLRGNESIFPYAWIWGTYGRAKGNERRKRGSSGDMTMKMVKIPRGVGV